jgi:hypothetical protein
MAFLLTSSKYDIVNRVEALLQDEQLRQTVADPKVWLIILISLFLIQVSFGTSPSLPPPPPPPPPPSPPKRPSHHPAAIPGTKIPQAVELRERLHGTWELVSYRIRVQKPIGFTSIPMGETASGRLVYTRDGRMSVHIQKPDTSNLLSVSPHWGFWWEKSRAASHYMAYSGTFDVGRPVSSRQQIETEATEENEESNGSESNGEVVEHAIQHSLLPNWIGPARIRLRTTLGGDEHLTLRPHALPGPLGLPPDAVLEWRRISVAAGGER